MKTWLILDCHYLAWRAFYATGDLSYEDKPTGVIYGLLKYIPKVEREFNTSNIVFTFDHGKSKREELGCGYKQQRRNKEEELTKEEKERLLGMRKQITFLRDVYLKDIGFNNVFYQDGYEGDDIIASVVKHSIPKGDDAIIVSADKDLYQLITPKVSVWNPYYETMMTDKLFQEQYGIKPKRWMFVKAIAGCNTDGVKGIKGVGEKTAIKYLNNECTEKVRYQVIENKELLDCNLKLVKLPYEGVKKFKLKKDKITKFGWHKVVGLLGMRSLQNDMPLMKPLNKIGTNGQTKRIG